jgi:RNA polymerase sigma factor (sigma-70 family)
MVYRRRFNEFCSVANAIVHDRERAKDAVQEAFASALRNKQQLRREGALESWLWRSVVNAAHDQRRRRSDVVAEFDADRVHEPASGDDGRVVAALGALPERQRLVLFLRYYGDLDYRRIAEILGLSTGTVAATIHQAQRSVRRRLEVAVDD